MTIIDTALHTSLRTLKLSGMLETLDARLAQAQAGELGHLDFLQVLCSDEITRRENMSMAGRLRRARFDEQRRTGRGYRTHRHCWARILLRSHRQTRRRRTRLNQQATTANCG